MNALRAYAKERHLTMNLGKTKMMIFNTEAQWVVTKSAPQFSYGVEILEHLTSYV